MRFAYPRFPAEFEIPDEWWSEAGMGGFMSRAIAYRSKAEVGLIPLKDIEPPFRKTSCPHDFRGFQRDRLIAVLRGIVRCDEIPAVELRELAPQDDWHLLPYRFQVCDGFHRYHASVAAGFDFLPATA